MSSAAMSRVIYEQLGPAGLAERTTGEWDQRTVDLVLELIGAGSQRVLDAGCGYGRIGIPLLLSGKNVVGVDISPKMLRAAQAQAADHKLHFELQLADICELPFESNQFDAVICMWLTFNELLTQEEQQTALNEMNRVLIPGGRGILDGPPFQETGDDEPVSGVTSPTNEDEDDTIAIVSFDHLLAQAGIVNYQQFVDDCPGRPRQFLTWYKEMTS